VCKPTGVVSAAVRELADSKTMKPLMSDMADNAFANYQLFSKSTESVMG